MAKVRTRLKDYHDTLLTAFRVIEQKARGVEGCNRVADAAAAARDKLSAQTTPSTTWKLSVTPNLQVPVSAEVLVRSPGSGYVLIGGNIECARDGIVEQSTAVALVVHEAPNGSVKGACCYKEHRGRHVVLRRVHWDVTGATRAAGAPMVHMQVGGNPKSFYPIPDGEFHHCAGHWIEPPRMPSLPLDFVLVVDLMLRQIDTPLRDLVNEREWIAVRRRSTELWVVPYCKAVGRLQDSDLVAEWYRSIGDIPSRLVV